MDTSIVFVTGSNNEPMVSSRMVAEKFRKRHDNVLRALAEQVIPLVSEQFRQLNFELAIYSDEQGKPRQEYKMTKDGFAILAMGFTGEDAMAWKEAFIAAFNQAIGSVSELREELARKESVILKLQGRKNKKRERRWLVPSFEAQLPGFPKEPKMVLKPQTEIKQPELNIAKYNHLKRTIEGIERQMAALKREIGMS
jgi:Rha family phage regulatory protein